ncbi:MULTISPECIES: hypothetical protein [unclassified Chamaesiphon]|nr:MULTISPECIES: hypothetical protein [unclassified Chamaesiphon]
MKSVIGVPSDRYLPIGLTQICICTDRHHCQTTVILLNMAVRSSRDRQLK